MRSGVGVDVRRAHAVGGAGGVHVVLLHRSRGGLVQDPDLLGAAARHPPEAVHVRGDLGRPLQRVQGEGGALARRGQAGGGVDLQGHHAGVGVGVVVLGLHRADRPRAPRRHVEEAVVQVRHVGLQLVRLRVQPAVARGVKDVGVHVVAPEQEGARRVVDHVQGRGLAVGVEHGQLAAGRLAELEAMRVGAVVQLHQQGERLARHVDLEYAGRAVLLAVLGEHDLLIVRVGLHPQAAPRAVAEGAGAEVRVPGHVVGVHDGAGALGVGHEVEMRVGPARVVAHRYRLGGGGAALGGHAGVAEGGDVARAGHRAAAIEGEVVAVDGPAAGALHAARHVDRQEGAPGAPRSRVDGAAEDLRPEVLHARALHHGVAAVAQDGVVLVARVRHGGVPAVGGGQHHVRLVLRAAARAHGGLRQVHVGLAARHGLPGLAPRGRRGVHVQRAPCHAVRSGVPEDSAVAAGALHAHG
mmetsp:Transcript_23523/g.63995  ORF Transcript_23523/g.63995 Transcript_23523/m.63995 type:complete len:468 (-) Transcript_23523:135-1538(-)